MNPLLLVAGLLAALLPAATAILGRQQEPPCDPTLLAKHFIRFCAPDPDTPTAQCCEPVLAAVDLGGGVSCLFRVAAEPHLATAGLDITTVFNIYNFCGGVRRAGGNLGALLPAATPISGRQEGGPCYPALLATQVVLFCSPDDKPTAHCCKPVLAAVDLGGGVPCLFRVAAEPHLAKAAINITALAKIYKSCGGLLHGGANVADTCEVSAGPAYPGAFISEPPSGAPGRPKQDDGDSPVLPRRKLNELCDPFSLGSSLATSCGELLDYPTHRCCVQVLRTVDQDCVCAVAEIPELMVTGFGVQKIWQFYGPCGGTRPIPTDHSVCAIAQSPPPPSPPATAPPPPATTTSTDRLLQKYLDKIASLVTETSAISYTLGGLVASAGAAFAIWRWRKSQNLEMGAALGDRVIQSDRLPAIEMVVQRPERAAALGDRVQQFFRRNVAPAPGRITHPVSSTSSSVPSGPAPVASAVPAVTGAPPIVPAPSAPPIFRKMLLAED